MFLLDCLRYNTWFYFYVSQLAFLTDLDRTAENIVIVRTTTHAQMTTVYVPVDVSMDFTDLSATLQHNKYDIDDTNAWNGLRFKKHKRDINK